MHDDLGGAADELRARGRAGLQLSAVGCQPPMRFAAEIAARIPFAFRTAEILRFCWTVRPPTSLV